MTSEREACTECLSYDELGHTPGRTSERSDEVEVRFVRLVPNELIEQVVTFSTENAEFAGEMRITWIFDKLENGTKVTVLCENVPEGIRAEDHEAGLTST